MPMLILSITDSFDSQLLVLRRECLEKKTGGKPIRISDTKSLIIVYLKSY